MPLSLIPNALYYLHAPLGPELGLYLRQEGDEAVFTRFPYYEESRCSVAEKENGGRLPVAGGDEHPDYRRLADAVDEYLRRVAAANSVSRETCFVADASEDE